MGDLTLVLVLTLKKKLPEIQKVCHRPALPSHFLGWPWAPASFPLRNPLGAPLADELSTQSHSLPPPRMQHIHLP